MSRLRGCGRRERRELGGLLALVMLASSCGYQSSYVPPVDGRARVIWNERDSEATVTLAGAGLTQACEVALRQLTGHERMPLLDSFVQLPESPSEMQYRPGSYGGEYWVPRYYGPNIVVVHPGVPPLLPRPPLFVPMVVRHGGPIYRVPPAVGGVRGGARFGSGGGGRFGGGGGGGDAGKGLAILAVIAIVVMPVISITLATVRPESERQASQAIDAVNAYNDMLRGGNSPCDPAVAAAVGGVP